MNRAEIELVSENPGQTFEIGLSIGKRAADGDVFALSGELGSGKTCFTGGLARGLGIGEDYAITSPTFTLINEYSGRCRLYHCDVYRLSAAEELADLGFDEYLSGKGVAAIEWAEKIPEALPPDAVFVSFAYVDENRRKIRISGPAQRVRDLLRDISREV
ncbi:MAG: tRNA (adenosine(37)-N6)-threonylcarbamoyltransferase complex ATPase subunit type 1 TsaE [Smithellaceae bacterium]|jgi:tRNA threonylcarbamoyladenosine biosynthesis protein TsaE|nr:tRNA (adenosine(37)-N6)-threonylcarbamoyltransferase complex ATPase subunit type 1 TsaE [Smithellaceae bacterium]MDD3258023.1 tRNA (adenosine(37)-N6)-threonylcarbamoyltransferase complex ATPase subunit type 1 TsaE [Smithellaceae bacterium]MDD3848118.1 tRNA (adenosine(37)-N6)-threonylcarbamoyltransferase complex ATPase subunit type 1 TsaE [Smithellaceae bacterium]HOG11809.1 tRNA (adenosine(37)-N6)-threonylcarbamoyltransferase complex ATPase subunit type 1 TsaE [Smithellaceae bacterium]HOQ7252